MNTRNERPHSLGPPTRYLQLRSCTLPYCQRLEDETAILSAMTYVDLNPIRAGMAEDLPGSDHTSAQRRIAPIEANRRKVADPLGPIFGNPQQLLLPINQAQYLDLVDQTGRALHPGKRGRIEAQVPPRATAPLKSGCLK